LRDKTKKEIEKPRNIKWFFSEILKMYSAEKSFFSKKRVESGVAFFIGEWGLIYFLIKSYATITMSEVALWATIQFAIAGYIINQIQKEKKTNESGD